MAKMKAVQVPKAGADFEIVEREIPPPGAGQVRIRVEASRHQSRLHPARLGAGSPSSSLVL
jgi:NADPH:quinone reductase-like Zn-dependent oxidoreductase